MIALHPAIESRHPHTCPDCAVGLEVRGWYIPGMRNLAELVCRRCGREFYGDLPSGHGLYMPILLDRESGRAYDRYEGGWFAGWLRESYARRGAEPLGFTVEEIRPLRDAVLLNCLDTVYGHCLLKLLNAQYYLDRRPDLDLVVLVPRALRWLVPDGVAAVWTVELPLREGTVWSDWLAGEIARRVGAIRTCWLSMAFSHPHADDFRIERFTRVLPFPIEEWEARLGRPTVTYVWREDRVWESPLGWGRVGAARRRWRKRWGLGVQAQRRRLLQLAATLRRAFPGLDIGVVGIGTPGDLPGWIEDLRAAAVDDVLERRWCERYARSHVAIGVHGSNMLLPSAHAGAVVELMPEGRWGNLLHDLLLRSGDARETLWRIRVLPTSVSAEELASCVSSLLRHHLGLLLGMGRDWCDHGRAHHPMAWSRAVLARVAGATGP